MATDRDDDVSRRYRALPREEPPAALDAAILAASRRAVHARPGGVRRWGPPLSIAAMLVLASGIVLRMQAEQPGIETSAPERGAAPASLPPEAPARQPATAPAEPPPASPEPQSPAASSFVPEAKRIDAPAAKPSPPKRLQKTAPLPAPEMAAAPPRETPSTERMFSPPTIAPAPPPAAAAQAAPVPPSAAPDSALPSPSMNLSSPQAARREAAPEQRAKSAASAGAAANDAQQPETPEAALERIAKLRAEGRDAEADRALESFVREHPDYRIPDAAWERVRPRPR